MIDICLVNALFPPDAHGGAEQYVRRAAHGLQERGFEVAVVTSKPYDGPSSLRPTVEVHDGLQVWRFYPPNLSHLSDGTGDGIVEKALWRGVDLVNLPAARAVGTVLDRLDPAVVHTNNLFGISTLVGRAVQRRNVRHVHTLHDYGLVCPKSNLLRDLTAPEGERVVCEDPPLPCRAYARQRRSTLGTPDLVTGPSQHVVDVHRDHGFFDGVETQRLRLGVDDVADNPPPVTDEPSLLYVGQQLEAKGLETLFAAADRLPDVTVHVCGTGPYADRTEAAAAERDNLHYHGFVSEERLADLRHTAAAAVVPSIWMENSPMTVYESYAAGLPVIGSDIGGIPELIDPGETGFLFEPADVDGLVTAIRRLFAADREPLQRGALAWAREHTMAAHVDRLLDEAYRLSAPTAVD
ncbi:glycosyltransferase [Haloplanus halophilus]|uniref:glycosyltransferase n=1 Tax=Haloplanus halophilus TaxID=2949993 RepID=UPI0020407D0A|nr:glycosyltransferase [Haloplanus sp. GDY1]